MSVINISGFLPQESEVDSCYLPYIHLEPNGSVSEERRVRFRKNSSEVTLPRIRNEVEIIDR